MKDLIIDSKYVGVPWKQVIKEVTWRMTTNYAAAIGDENPLYFDDESEEGLLTHPMFAVTLGWPLAQKIKDYIDLPYSDEALARNVHYTEYLDLRKPIKPGDKVKICSDIAAAVPHRSGTEVVFRFKVTDMEGAIYHIEHMGVMLRGVSCPDGGKGEADLPARLRARSYQAAWSSDVKIAKTLPYVYDGCTDIVFDIHTSPAYAHSVGLPDIVVQGTASLALSVREIVSKELGGDPRGICAIGARFTGMVFAGNTVSVELLERREAPDGTELFFRTINKDTGKVAVSDGYIRMR